MRREPEAEVSFESEHQLVDTANGAYRRRRTIGLLITRPDVEIDGAFLRGVAMEAEASDVDVLCFAGNHLRHKSLSHTVFSLADEVHLDGIIISTPLGHLTPRDVVQAFCARYAHVPVVTGALGLSAYPSVSTDSYGGLYDLLSHLIETHDCRRIAYIEGPAGQPEAEERFRAYRAALEDHGIGFDAARVVPGDFLRASGTAAMHTLWERFGSETTGLALDAVVAANDDMAVAAYEVLVAKGLQVPRDVALAGFDDAESGRALMPPLTTVRQSFEVAGRAALKALVQLMDGEVVPERITVPSEVVLRRSCGCAPLQVVRATAFTQGAASTYAADWSPTGSLEVSLWSALLHAVGLAVPDLGTDDFLSIIELHLRTLYATWGDPDEVHDLLSRLRRRLVAVAAGSGRSPDAAQAGAFGVLSPEQLGRAEDLLHQARIMTGDIGRYIEVVRATREQRWAGFLRDFDTAISRVIDLGGLLEPVESFLPRWHIRELYLVWQATPSNGQDLQVPGGDWRDPSLPSFSQERRLVLVYRDGNARIQDVVFRAPSLLPATVGEIQSSVLVIIPVMFRGQLFGYALISYPGEAGAAAPGQSEVTRHFIYQRIADELGSVLYRAQLLTDAEQARLRAEASLAEIRQTREIAERLQRAPDAEAVLRVALEELSTILGAPRAIARLGTRTAETAGTPVVPGGVVRDDVEGAPH